VPRRSKRPHKGLICPRCGGREFKTTRTERLRRGVIRRRKICLRCGWMAITAEEISDDVYDYRHRKGESK
jgi:ribosomal protein S27AE